MDRRIQFTILSIAMMVSSSLHTTSQAYTEYDSTVDLPNPERGSAPFCVYSTSYSRWDKYKNDEYWHPDDSEGADTVYLHIPPYPDSPSQLSGLPNPFTESTDDPYAGFDAAAEQGYRLIDLELNLAAFTGKVAEEGQASDENYCKAKEKNPPLIQKGIPMEGWNEDAGTAEDSRTYYVPTTEDNYYFDNPDHDPTDSDSPPYFEPDPNFHVANTLLWLNAVRNTFIRARDAGMKILLSFDYMPSDIDKEHLLGYEDTNGGERIIGHLETIREWFFNSSCQYAEELQEEDDECKTEIVDNYGQFALPLSGEQGYADLSLLYLPGPYPEDPLRQYLYKDDFSSTVYAMEAGFIGTAGAEWHSSCWPEVWETGASADVNREALVEFERRMLPETKILLRTPFIKNDFFDKCYGIAPDLTYMSRDCEWELTPASDGDLVVPQERTQSGSTWHDVFAGVVDSFQQFEYDGTEPQYDNAYFDMTAKTMLGHFNTGFMINNNEGCTWLGYPSPICNDAPCSHYYPPEDRTQYDYYLADSLYASLGGDTGVGHFYTQTGINCTTEFEENAETEMKYGVKLPPWRHSASCDDVDMIRYTALDRDLYRCIPVNYYLRSTCTDGYQGTPSSEEEWKWLLDETGIYYNYFENEEILDDDVCVGEFDGTPCQLISGEGRCTTLEVVYKEVWDSAESRNKKVPKLGGICTTQPPPPSITVRKCIPEAVCVPYGKGAFQWYAGRHVNHLKGLRDSAYFRGSTKQYLIHQPWSEPFMADIGYRIYLADVAATTNGFELRLSLTFKNSGFAAPMYWRPFRLVFLRTDNESQYDIIDTEHDIRTIIPSCPVETLNDEGECPEEDEISTVFQTTIPLDDLQDVWGEPYKVGIWLPDADKDLTYRSSRFSIRLANAEGELGWTDGPGQDAAGTDTPTPTPEPEDTAVPESSSEPEYTAEPESTSEPESTTGPEGENGEPLTETPPPTEQKPTESPEAEPTGEESTTSSDQPGRSRWYAEFYGVNWLLNFHVLAALEPQIEPECSGCLVDDECIREGGHYIDPPDCDPTFDDGCMTCICGKEPPCSEQF